MRGVSNMTFYICFGKWAGFQLRSGFCIGIVLGFVSIMIMPADIERILVNYAEIKNIKRSLKCCHDNIVGR